MEVITDIQSCDYDILTSVWILSCNDEDSIISYEGIKYRLSLDSNYDLRTLIENRRELFRTNVPENRVKGLKNQMRQGKKIPDWLKKCDEKEKSDKIEALKSTDFFRCQFRIEPKAPKAPLEIIDWGLKHIDRLRRAEFETSDFKVKKITNIWIPLFSLLVALISVLSSVYIQRKTQEAQFDIAQYEISFKSKQSNYAAFMRNLFYAFESAGQMNTANLSTNLDKLEISYYNIEPFLNKNLKIDIWEQYQQFTEMCYVYGKLSFDERTDSVKQKYYDSFHRYKNYFRENLYPVLFENDFKKK